VAEAIVLLWFLVTARIQNKTILISNAQLDPAQKYLSDFMCKHLSAISARYLSSTDLLDNFAQRVTCTCKW